ncbi:hypothetical protein EDB84DRAFT_1142047 [Lactarius hengduanensis]|nr:hypothetical protein EDB84DRAFT_1142047 [Lactarius hengduanensis]
MTACQCAPELLSANYPYYGHSRYNLLYCQNLPLDLPICPAEGGDRVPSGEGRRDQVFDRSWEQARMVPALVYGSPKSGPENPSPESARITQSLVLLEFVADLYPDSGLLPKDPVERARVRFFIDAVSTKVSPPFFAFLVRSESPDVFIAAVAEIQELLPPAAQFAVGGSLHNRGCSDRAVPRSLGCTISQ